MAQNSNEVVPDNLTIEFRDLVNRLSQHQDELRAQLDQINRGQVGLRAQVHQVHQLEQSVQEIDQQAINQPNPTKQPSPK